MLVRKQTVLFPIAAAYKMLRIVARSLVLLSCIRAAKAENPKPNLFVQYIEGATGLHPIRNQPKAWVWGFENGTPLRLYDLNLGVRELNHPLPPGAVLRDTYEVED